MAAMTPERVRHIQQRLHAGLGTPSELEALANAYLELHHTRNQLTSERDMLRNQLTTANMILGTIHTAMEEW